MATSRFELTGRILAGIAAASLLAGVSLDAQAAPGNKGIIELKLSSVSNASRDNKFTWDDPTDGPGPILEQRFNLPKNTKCVVAENLWIDQAGHEAGPTLVNVTAIGPTGTLNPRVGLQYGSLGVYDNSNGTSCTRMTASIGEGLLFQPLVGGFDRLELDMELKGNAVFRLQINPHPSGDVTKGGNVYYLRSGTSQATAPVPANVTNCAGGSDSGPDSGPNDNCPWVIEDLGGSFDLRAVETGEGSLEGGGDGLPTTSTKIFLTSLIDVGTLGCSTTDDENKTAWVYSDDPNSPVAACQVSRINYNSELPDSCNVDIAYRLETFNAASMCELDKTANDQEQLSGMLDVTFVTEDRTSLDGVGLTRIKFRKPDGTFTASFYPDLCAATRTDDPDGTGAMIVQVLAGTLPGYERADGNFVYATSAPPGFDFTTLKDGVKTGDSVSIEGTDEVPYNGYVDWACILDHRVEVVPGTLLQQVFQKILFWGDINFARNVEG